MSPALDDHLEAARALQSDAGVIDLHVDSIIENRLFGYDLRKRHRAGIRGQPLFWHADIPRMLEASYRGAAMGIHHFAESARAFRSCNRQIDYLDRISAEDDRVLRARKPEDWGRAKELGLLALKTLKPSSTVIRWVGSSGGTRSAHAARQSLGGYSLGPWSPRRASHAAQMW